MKYLTQLHAHIIIIGLHKYNFAQTKLVTMYDKFSDSDNACQVFD